MSVDNPLKWLLKELPAYLPREHHALLMERYEANKKAYEREIKIRYAERIIKTTERFSPSPERDARLTRWRTKLDKLKEDV